MRERFKALKNNLLRPFYRKTSCLRRLEKIIEVKNEHRILFVCLGNICRSAYAESYFQTIKCNNIIVRSAGLSTSNGKEAYRGAIEEARRRGINLNEHRTKKITQELIEEADIIFCMEPYQISEIKKVFKNKSKALLPLGVFAENDLSTAIIYDPYGKDEQSFKECFDIIDSACNRINAMIKQGAK